MSTIAVTPKKEWIDIDKWIAKAQPEVHPRLFRYTFRGYLKQCATKSR